MNPFLDGFGDLLRFWHTVPVALVQNISACVQMDEGPDPNRFGQLSQV